MILDSEQQRGIIMQLVSSTQINGTYQQVRGTISALDDLMTCTMNAKIETLKPEPEPIQEGLSE